MRILFASNKERAVRCLEALGHPRKNGGASDSRRIMLTSAAGKKFDQDMAVQYSLLERLTIICGHYLGVDERLLEMYEVDEVSIGDYILTGGEPAGLVVVDSVARLIPKVLGNFESALGDSHLNRLLGTPSYTRPADYQGLQVPSILLSGDHAAIERFRHREAIRKCMVNRPDILDSDELNDDDRDIVEELKRRELERNKEE